jgi:hypothetical protein
MLSQRSEIVEDSNAVWTQGRHTDIEFIREICELNSVSLALNCISKRFSARFGPIADCTTLDPQST